MGEPAKVKCPDTMLLNIISDKIKGKKAIKFYRILFAGWNISYAPQLRSASWSRSRSTRTFARWPARTPATSMRWPISYLFLPVLAQMSSCQKVSWHTFVLCGNRGLRWHKSRKTKGCGRHPLVAWTLTCSHVNWCSLKAAWFNFASMALIWVYNLILWMDQ